MIFLTVGTQLPFDRLVALVDKFAESSDATIVGQIGNSLYKPSAIQCQSFFAPDEMDRWFVQSDVVVSHAGMGSIINCLKLTKPIIIFPRLSSLGEHRNDHQLDTLNSFDNVKGVHSARDESGLLKLLGNYKTLIKPVGFENPEISEMAKYLLSLIDLKIFFMRSLV